MTIRPDRPVPVALGGGTSADGSAVVQERRDPAPAPARTGSGSQQPLRIGVALGRRDAPRWVATVLEALLASGDEIVVLGRPPGVPRRRASLTARALAAYGWFDQRVFGRAGDPTASVDLLRAVPGLADRWRDAAHAGGRSDGPRPDLDVVLCLGGGRDSAPEQPRSREGWWSFRQASLGGTPDPSGGPDDVSVDEVLARSALTATELVRVGPDGAAAVIGRVVSSTDRLSARRGARNHYPKVADLVRRALRDLRLDGSPPALGDDHGIVSARTPRSAAGAVAVAAVLVAAFVGRRVHKLLAPGRWIVAVHEDASGGRPGEPWIGALVGRPMALPLRVLEPPAGFGWADPFPVEGPDGPLLFIEEWVDADRRGRIAVMRPDGRGAWSAPEPVLSLGHHLSYPFVFEWGGAWYAMPEQHALGRLDLYRATRFPSEWRWDRTLIPEPLADATMAEVEGRWWLFAARRSAGGSVADELHLFSAPGPLGPWTPHARNPVVSDVRTARPAGRLFWEGGAWYRVAQDGGPNYGHAIVVLRIDRLDDGAYREHIAGRIPPSWRPGLMATHTLNRAGGITALDGAERRMRRLPRRR